MLCPLRVLVVGPKYSSPHSRGGMATVAALMRDTRDPRFRIRLVATYVDDPTLMRYAVGVAGMARAVAVLLTRRTEILHVHLAHRGSVVRKSVPLAVARAVGIPTVVHAHSYDFVGWFDGLSPRVQRLVRRLLRADGWLVLGAGLAEQYADRLHLTPGLVRVLPNPVQVPTVVRAPSATGPVPVVFLGRMGQRKGTYDLVAAVALLSPAARAAVRVIAAGDGEVDGVRAAAARAGVGDIITVLPWVAPAQRDELLADSEIFVLPSYDEGLPMALLEAMGWGLVPVTTPVGAIPEVVTHDVDALLVPSGDPPALARALESLVLDPELRLRLGRAARARASDFDVSAWFDALAVEWTRLARGGASGSEATPPGRERPATSTPPSQG